MEVVITVFEVSIEECVVGEQFCGEVGDLQHGEGASLHAVLCFGIVEDESLLVSYPERRPECLWCGPEGVLFLLGRTTYVSQV